VRQVLQIPFAGGLDEGTQEEVSQPGAWNILSHLVADKSGSMGKPHGVEQRSMSTVEAGTISIASRLFATGKELSIVDGQKLYSHSTTANLSRTVGRISEPLHERIALAEGGATGAVSSWDVAYANGYAIVVALIGTSSVTARAWVFDATTWALVLGPTVLKPGIAIAPDQVRVVAYGTDAFAIVDDGGTNLRRMRLDLSNIAGGWANGTSLATTLGGAISRWDAHSLTDRYAVAFYNNSGTNSSTTVLTADSGGTITTTNINVGAVATAAVGLAGTQAGTLWLGYATTASNNVNVVGLNPVTLAITGTAATIVTLALQPISIGIVDEGSSFGTVVASTGAPAALGAITGECRFGQFQLSAGVVSGTSTPTIWYRTHLVARPFRVGGRNYAGVTPLLGSDPALAGLTGGTPRPEVWLVDVTAEATASNPGRCAGNTVPRLGYTAVVPDLPAANHFIQLSSTKFAVLYGCTRTAETVGLELATYDFAPTTQWQAARYGDLQTVSGATPSVYDGSGVTEISFLQAPELYATAAAGGLTGTFQWVGVWEAFDGRGWVAISQPSTPKTLVLAGQGADIRVYSLQFTQRTSLTSIRCAIYRTKNQGRVLFRSINVAATPTANSSTTTDNTTDANLGAPLYTQPLVVPATQPRQCPPPLIGLITHQDRVFGIASPRTIWFSGQLIDGESPWFTDQFQIPVLSRLPLTALASMDGRLVLFSREEIGYVDGQGPPDNGTAADYSTAQFIAGSIGAVDWRAVVQTPMGVMFQSARGIELLSRSMQVVPFFGTAVEDLTSTYPIVTSSVYRRDDSRVYFTCISGTETNPTAGVVIVYDLIQQTWSTFYPQTALVSAALTDEGRYYMAPVSGGVGGLFRESTDYAALGSGYIPSTIETPWFKLSGLQGYQRAKSLTLLFNSLTPHTLTISVAYDYSSSYTQVTTFTAAELAAMPKGQVSIDLAVQKTQAVRFKIDDGDPTPAAMGTGQGPQFIGLAVEYTNKAGRFRLPPAQVR
jgi:hypothetical protein